MIKIEIPGHSPFKLEKLVLDYNGTLAIDGKLIEGVGKKLTELSDVLTIYVITADTFGKAREGLMGIPCELVILPPGEQDLGKRDFIRSVGVQATICVGNGRNDRLMLKEAALGIAVIQEECAAAATIMAADVVALDILSALDLLLHPLRLIATLRS